MVLGATGSSCGLWNCAQYGCRSASSGEMRLSGLKCSSLRNRSSASGEAEGKVASSRGVAGARMDSSIVAVMCVDAFGADHVHGVLLPGPYSS